jgi:hypothetical protein
MSQALAVAGLLAIAVLIASARLLHRQQQIGVEQRSQGWRIALLLIGQLISALLLYFTLIPPTVPIEARTMVVATAGATPGQMDAYRAATRIALPEAPALADAEPVPDLATALRRHPGTHRVRVVGAGLEARDRDAARGLALEFEPAALPRGVVELTAPDRAAAGAAFRVGGRVEGMRGGSIELVDPGRQRVDRAVLPGDGYFTLSATTRTPGLAVFELRLRDAKRKLVESLDLPLQVMADAQPRVLMLAGAPNPEWKYLRRWAADAGVPVHAQFSVGGGMQLGDAPLALDSANLAKFDLLVLDDRAWTSLGQGSRAALLDALRGGLGILLRVTGPLSASTRSQLRTLGFEVDGAAEVVPVRLGGASAGIDALRARIGAGSRDAPTTDVPLNPPVLTRRALRIGASDASSLLDDAAGTPIATWRAEGRGRIGLWPLTDTYRLVLNGRRDLHGEVWGAAIATVARTNGARWPGIPAQARSGERMILCDVATDARVIAPDGRTVALLPERVSGMPVCAAFWPQESGWHVLQQQDARWPFHVRGSDAGSGLRAGALRDATLRLASSSHELPRSGATGQRSGPRWPWLLGWLLATAGLWWLERSRAGRAPLP